MFSGFLPPSPDDHRDIPHGCSDPSAGAVFLTKLMRLDTRRAFRALREDPAVGIDVASLLLPPAVGLVAGAVLFQRQRASWRARDFSDKVNVALYSFRGSTKGKDPPLLVVRTLSEKRLDDIVTNEHGRSELVEAAKRHLCSPQYMGLVHMEKPSAKLWRNILLDAVSEQFAAGALQRDLGVPGVVCARYGLGLWSSRLRSTKLRVVLMSEASLQQAVKLAAGGSQPVYEHEGHRELFPLVLRLADALDIQPDNAVHAGAEISSDGADEPDGEGARPQPLVIPPASAVGTPVAGMVELCGAAGGG